MLTSPNFLTLSTVHALLNYYEFPDTLSYVQVDKPLFTSKHIAHVQYLSPPLKQNDILLLQLIGHC